MLAGMSRKKRRKPQRPRRPVTSKPPPSRPAGAVTVLEEHGTTEDGRGGVEPLVGLIATGALDAHLGVLQAAISRRGHELHREAGHRAAAQLRVGDRVRVLPGMRPQYLQGATGTVTGWSGRNAVVQLDMAVGRFATGTATCPPLGLERLTRDRPGT